MVLTPACAALSLRRNGRLTEIARFCRKSYRPRDWFDRKSRELRAEIVSPADPAWFRTADVPVTFIEK
jgi:hypothetical protein